MRSAITALFALFFLFSLVAGAEINGEIEGGGGLTGGVTVNGSTCYAAGHSCTLNSQCCSGLSCFSHICATEEEGGYTGGGGAGGGGTGGETGEQLNITLPTGFNCTLSIMREILIMDTFSKVTTYLTNSKDEGCTLLNYNFTDEIPESFAKDMSDLHYSIEPDSVDGRKVSWVFDRLLPGESLVLVYYVNYKVYPIALEQFELPTISFAQAGGPVVIPEVVNVTMQVPEDVYVGDVVGINLTLMSGTPVKGATIEVTTPLKRKLLLATDALGKANYTADTEGDYTYSVTGYKLIGLFMTTAIHVPTEEVVPPKEIMLILPEKFTVNETATITLVYANDSKPIPGVTIMLRSPSGKVIELVTDANGQVSFIPDEEGEYTFLGVREFAKETIKGAKVLTAEKQAPPMITPSGKDLYILIGTIISIVIFAAIVAGIWHIYRSISGKGKKKTGEE